MYEKVFTGENYVPTQWNVIPLRSFQVHPKHGIQSAAGHVDEHISKNYPALFSFDPEYYRKFFKESNDFLVHFQSFQYFPGKILYKSTLLGN